MNDWRMKAAWLSVGGAVVHVLQGDWASAGVGILAALMLCAPVAKRQGERVP